MVFNESRPVDRSLQTDARAKPVRPDGGAAESAPWPTRRYGMAVREPKDLLTMLADRGEEAIQRLSDAPGADRLLGAAQALRDRMDEMQKRIRGIDALEKRVTELEKRVEALSTPSTTRKRTTTSKPRARKPASGSGNA